MDDSNPVCSGQIRRQIQIAPRAAGCPEISAGRPRIFYFFGSDSLGDVRMLQAETSTGAATAFRILAGHVRSAGQPAQQLFNYAFDPLCVSQMAGVVVGNGLRLLRVAQMGLEEIKMVVDELGDVKYLARQ